MCRSTSEFCEVFFKQGKIDEIKIDSCSDYCAAHGLKCMHSYQVWEYTQCHESLFMKEFPELHKNQWSRYQYTTCDVPYDVRYGIGCVCGKFLLTNRSKR